MKTYGGICWLPCANEWQTWNNGETLKALVSSARRPEKLELLRKTSRWTSFDTFSTVPGFDKPSSALLPWKASYVSRTEEMRGLDASESEMLADRFSGTTGIVCIGKTGGTW